MKTHIEGLFAELRKANADLTEAIAAEAVATDAANAAHLYRRTMEDAKREVEKSLLLTANGDAGSLLLGAEDEEC